MSENKDIQFERNGETYLLLQEPPMSDAVVESVDSIYKDNDVYWKYICSGLHEGKPFEILVKNVFYDTDCDESGTWCFLNDEGKFWADDFTDIDDDVDDWYSDVINDAVREDMKSL